MTLWNLSGTPEMAVSVFVFKCRYHFVCDQAGTRDIHLACWTPDLFDISENIAKDFMN
jgi:hypothetical protein